MHFHKYPYISNFEFASTDARGSLKTSLGSYSLKVSASDEGIFHLGVSGKGWKVNDSQAGLSFKPGKPSAGPKLEVSKNRFVLRDSDGEVLLESAPRRFFGQCGDASIFEFVREKGDAFYGMGEKWTGLEHSGKTTKFWNTDVWGDFNAEAYVNGRPTPDPVYVSIPYLIIRRRGTYIGLLLDNPHSTFMSTGFKAAIAEQMEINPEGDLLAEELVSKLSDGRIHLGAESGQPNLFILVGPTLPELTRKFQNLVGTTPRPPAWALGYHQCRWGYESARDLFELDANFTKHEIPADGLWLDIDYMRGYRVFTFDEKHFPDPVGAIAKLNAKGRKVIPIIDPGVKWEKGYDVYERGRKADAYCKNPQGLEYIGLVWPGQTVFPDYSLPSARQWWSKEVADFASLGIHGAWLDMNDPSTGPSDNEQMCFDHGKKGHETYHNQYAFGMAQASREGFIKAHPDQRPFLLCRSGSTGSGRHTAIWTGDNYSNYHHLKSCISTTLNLALSGIPFNGPDAAGFGGDTTPELIQDWYKAGFLFPVLRNHSMKDTRKQEPWMFGPAVMKVLRKYVRLRYRLRPYLYQLFIGNELEGEAILRPLFYEFADTKALPLGKIDDQFLVGPSILQAPFVQEKQTQRDVVLPGRTRWFDISKGQWIDGGRRITVKADRENTPLYIRDASILPLARIAPADNAFDGSKVDFHVFLSRAGSAGTEYEFDDGLSFAYAKGAYTRVAIDAKRSRNTLRLTTETLHEGAGAPDFTVTTTAEITAVEINGKAARKVKAQGVPLGNYKTQTWTA
ncbi:MAG: hypothetical protein BGO12_13955 [Verrucomicrobia bacterium 61-8]|nr:hypothetical protein [Verrucomicrobiota bacterium]OJU99392.1 MAG: hypothetical protein BGO12_13955 [Verrucomicrobia bacterium 61-8]